MPPLFWYTDETAFTRPSWRACSGMIQLRCMKGPDGSHRPEVPEASEWKVK